MTVLVRPPEARTLASSAVLAGHEEVAAGPATVEAARGRDVRDAVEFLLSPVPGGALPASRLDRTRRDRTRRDRTRRDRTGRDRSSASPRGHAPSSPFRPTGTRVRLASRPLCGPPAPSPTRSAPCVLFPCRSP
ncbi:hypothetical protein AB0E81_11800 [Streptomyces sp. NPDC033538]|uniref:hypothetical protein n=1 Tax=Streptomyces sp. NPDC033538 TaxID=3155367 RepID=UPI0033C42A98